MILTVTKLCFRMFEFSFYQWSWSEKACMHPCVLQARSKIDRRKVRSLARFSLSRCVRLRCSLPAGVLLCPSLSSGALPPAVCEVRLLHAASRRQQQSARCRWPERLDEIRSSTSASRSATVTSVALCDSPFEAQRTCQIEQRCRGFDSTRLARLQSDLRQTRQLSKSARGWQSRRTIWERRRRGSCYCSGMPNHVVPD
jgi:hypothetical protein